MISILSFVRNKLIFSNFPVRVFLYVMRPGIPSKKEKKKKTETGYAILSSMLINI